MRLLLDRVDGIGLDVDLRVDGDVGRLDAGQAITVLRVVQESVTNVLRHAGGHAQASVHIAVTDHDVLVEVRDTGVGAGIDTGRGFGLIGLGERLDLLGGTLIAGPGEVGWQVIGSFTLDRAAGVPAPPARGCVHAVDSPALDAGRVQG